MSDYEIGYKKPPKSTRFKIGNKANLKGRPKRKAPHVAELINSGLNGRTQYTDGGRTKTASRLQLAIKKNVNEALKGNLRASEVVLKLLVHMQKFGDTAAQRILIRDWQPDRPGQTGEQKTREFALHGDAGTPDRSTHLDDKLHGADSQRI